MVTSRSATFEFEKSKTLYFSVGKFEISLNCEKLRSKNRNAFSIFGLKPDRNTLLMLAVRVIIFKTLAEVNLINVKQFNAYGDGMHDDTGAFTAAIVQAHSMAYLSTDKDY